MTIRKLRYDDIERLLSILHKTNVFSQEEIDVAKELMDLYLDKPDQKDYEFFCAADERDHVLGYTCFGPTPMTRGTFDLYWIAVDPSLHRHGVGKELLRFSEGEISFRGGRLIVVETSSRPDYEPTRKFYLSQEYREIARINEYYKAGDDLVIYGKYLSQ